MNNLYFNQFWNLLTSFLTVLLLLMMLFLIAQSAAFLTLTIESSLSAWTFFEFIAYQIPIQLRILMPVCLLAGLTSTFRTIFNSGEYAILRAAGISEHSFFQPAIAIGFLLCLLYAFLSFELAPRATQTLLRLEQQSAEQIAQSTLINAREPTRIGDIEIFVEETDQTSLKGLSLYGQANDLSTLMISAVAAHFISRPEGLALNLEQSQILRSQENIPQNTQIVDQVLVNLTALVRQNDGFSKPTNALSLTLTQLLKTSGKNSDTIEAHFEQAAKRILSTILIFLMPSWILFWQLLAQMGRAGTGPTLWIGPVSLIPVFALLEAPGSFLGITWGQTIGALIILMAIGFTGPATFTLRTWRFWRIQKQMKDSYSWS